MSNLSGAALQELVELLEGAGVSASVDPAELNVPAAWVTLEGIRQLNLAGELELDAVVYLIVGDQDHRRAFDALAELYNKATTVLDPDGVVVPQGVVLPDNPTPLPALRVPVTIPNRTPEV